MASWHEDTFAPVREARRLWERTAPQLTLDVDGALTEREQGGGAVESRPSLPRTSRSVSASRTELPDASTPTRTVATIPLAATGRPAATTNNNGRVGSPARESADAATGGSF